MPVYLRSSLFYLLLLLLLLVVVCCTLCNGVYAASNNNGQPQSSPLAVTAGKTKSIQILKITQINNILPPQKGSNNQSIEVKEYYSPFIVSAGNAVVVLAGVKPKIENFEKNATIISKYIVVNGDNKEWGAAVIDGSNSDDNKWTPQLAVQNEINKDGENSSVVKTVLGVARDNKIYLLFVNCSDKGSNDAKCDLNITIGAVSNSKTLTADKITWESKQKIGVDETITKSNQENPLRMFLFGGSAFITGKDNIAFVLRIKNDKKKNVFVVIYSEGDEGQTEFKVSKEESVDGCTPSFFPWEKNIIMMPTYCEGTIENQKVKELSVFLGSNWSESTGPFARLLGFMQDKNDFTATKINETNILLFTQKKLKTPSDAGKKNDAHVWFTDGKRVHSVGRILTDDNITSASLLHTNSELFALHQNWDNTGQQKNITLTRMEEQLGNITSVVAAWKNSDAIVQQLFKTAVPSLPTFNATDGLVGFLSGNSEGNNNSNWIDEYLYVNATVKTGSKVNYGYKFDGNGAGAKWPVGKQKEDQPYNFTDLGFTLLANVTIDGGVGDKDNSVLGVGYNESDKTQKTVGLLCTQGGEWVVTGNDVASDNILGKRLKCQQGSAYLAALVLNTNKLSVYIDGEELNVKESKEIKIDKTHNITHFYFGTDESQNGVESHVTVRNVLLYNRPFSHKEVEKLKIIKQDKPSDSGDNSANHTDSQGRTQGDGEITGGSSGGDGGSSDTTDKDTKITDMTSSPQPESSTLCGGFVGVLIISLLFGLHGYYLQ